MKRIESIDEYKARGGIITRCPPGNARGSMGWTFLRKTSMFDLGTVDDTGNWSEDSYPLPGYHQADTVKAKAWHLYIQGEQ